MDKECPTEDHFVQETEEIIVAAIDTALLSAEKKMENDFSLSEGVFLVLTEIIDRDFGGDPELAFRAMVTAYMTTSFLSQEELGVMIDKYADATKTELLKFADAGREKKQVQQEIDTATRH